MDLGFEAEIGEVGLEVELVPFQGVIQMMPLIVRGDLKMIGGTLSASYFNSVARGMPGGPKKPIHTPMRW